MMAGGKDGVVKVTGVARRPSIRPKPVTPPRAGAPSPRTRLTPTWTLPPVRTPAPRVASRPVLALVEHDETNDDVPSVLPADRVATWWRQPRPVALVVASVLAAAFATTAIVWMAIARRDAAEASVAVSTTTISSASLAIEPPVDSPELAPGQHDSALPVVDVNSLPAAPTQMATGSAGR